MKLRALSLALLVALSGFAQAVETKKGRDSENSRERNFVRYVTTVSEYRLDQSFPVTAPISDIIAFIKEHDVKPLETVRLSSVSDTEALAQVGRQVSVTTGQVVSRGGTVRQTEDIEIGTVLRVRIAPHEKGALAEVDFTASRLLGDPDADTRPAIVTTTVQTTQTFQLGKLQILGSSSGDQTSYVFGTISEAP